MKVLVILLLMVSFSFASVLSDLVDAMQDRTFVQMPEDDGLLALTIHRALLYWSDSGEWDPVRKRVIWMGGPGTCCENPARYRYLTYDVASDTWDITQTSYTGSGHAYDGNALDPATGKLYFGKKGDTKVKVLNGSSFSTLPDIPFGAATTPALCWFPDINSGNGALLYLSQKGNLAWYNGSSWSVIEGATALDSYNTFMQYSPTHKIVWFGAGNGSDRVHYKLDVDLNVTRYNNSPISLNNNKAKHTIDPVTGNFLVGNTENDSWYEFDPVTDDWTQISGISGPNPLGFSGNCFVVPIADYGVNLVFNHYWEYRRVFLYKHTTGSTVEERAPAISMVNPAIQAAPNPFRTQISIGLTGQNATGTIFDASGKMVYQLNSPVSVWNAAGFPAGVYVIRAKAGNKNLSSRIILTQ